MYMKPDIALSFLHLPVCTESVNHRPLPAAEHGHVIMPSIETSLDNDRAPCVHRRRVRNRTQCKKVVASADGCREAGTFRQPSTRKLKFKHERGSERHAPQHERRRSESGRSAVSHYERTRSARSMSPSPEPGLWRKFSRYRTVGAAASVA